MAAPRTLAEMRAQALRYADLDGFPSVVGSADHFLNARIRQLYDLLITCRGEDFYAQDKAIATVADQSLYTFTAFGAPDFYRLVSLRAARDNDYAELNSFDSADLPMLLELEASGSGYHPGQLFKRIRPTGIEVRPAPSDANITLTMSYIPACPALVNDGDTFDGINGWEAWAELGAAIDLRQKEELDPSGLVAQQMEIGERIKLLAASRDNSRPVKRRRVRRRWFRGWRPW